MFILLSTCASAASLTVVSENVDGSAMSGYYTVLYRNDVVMGTGFTPTTFSLTNDRNYVVEVHDYGNFVFDHWDSGSIDRERPISINSATQIKAFYRPLSGGNTTSSSLSVSTFDLNGSAIEGLYTVLYSGMSIVKTGFSPVNFTLTSGRNYTVEVHNYGIYSFDHWDSGLTESERPISISNSTSIMAYYRTPYSGNNTTNATTNFSLTVRTVDSNLSEIEGAGITVTKNGTLVGSGDSPETFILEGNQSYIVSASDFGSYMFERWDDNSTQRNRSIVISSNTIITAYYRIATPNTTNSTLNVLAWNEDGSQLEGINVSVISNGTMQSEHSPASFSLESNMSYTVTVQNVQGKLFDRWEDNSTTIDRDIFLSGNTTLSAYFRDEISEMSILTVSTIDLANNTVSGIGMTLTCGNITLNASSPALFNLTNIQSCTIHMDDSRSYVFDHWNDGFPFGDRELSISSDTSITAYYRHVQNDTSYTLTAGTRHVNGSLIEGLYTVLYNGSAVVETGFSPVSFVLEAGQNYTIEVQDYAQYRFDHWDDNSTRRDRSVSLTANKSVTAYYNTGTNTTNQTGIALPYFDPLTQNLTREQLDADPNWVFGGSAVELGGDIDYFEDQNGLHIGVRPTIEGQYQGFFIMNRVPVNATSFSTKITSPSATIPSGFFQNGLYVQGLHDIIYISCVMITGPDNTIWTVVGAKGGSEVADTFEVLWADSSEDQPLTRECRLVTNGDNYLDAYLDGELIYHNDSLNLEMEVPFYAFLEVQSSHSESMLYGTYSDFAIDYAPIQDTQVNYVTVTTVGTDGNIIEGLYTTLWSRDALLDSGFSPHTFILTGNDPYQVAVSDFSQYEFDHWSDGSTDRFHAIDSETLQAEYRIMG